MISITGGGCSDLLSSEFFANSEQISFSLVFLRMRVSGFRQTYKFASIESGITLLLLNRKSSSKYFLVTEKRIVYSLLKKE